MKDEGVESTIERLGRMRDKCHPTGQAWEQMVCEEAIASLERLVARLKEAEKPRAPRTDTERKLRETRNTLDSYVADLTKAEQRLARLVGKLKDDEFFDECTKMSVSEAFAELLAEVNEDE
jgi:chromatin segregation and condensation protein Rec8/ScpA/Scc1 (kleisin family)